MRLTTYPCACGARSAIEHPPTGCPLATADPMAGLPARSCNNPEHEARRAELRADREHGTPCLVCGAPIVNGFGHDEGCMARRECEACGGPVRNLRETKDRGLVGDCPEHGTTAAWVTGTFQNANDQLADEYKVAYRARLRGGLT